MTTALDQTNTVRPIRVRRGQRDGRVVPVTLDADPESLQVATGAADPDLALQLLGQAINATPAVARSTADADVGTAAISATLAAVSGIRPRDPLEGMLATQMVAVHNLAMEMAQRALLPGQTPEGVDMNVSRATRLMKTFAAQIEALVRYRAGGQQTVTVQHVHVADGGQAVIGPVTAGGGGRSG